VGAAQPYGRDENTRGKPSDEDIFEKILSDDAQSKKDDIQIIGDSRRTEELEYDARDSELEEKRGRGPVLSQVLQHNDDAGRCPYSR
jgi:hypothetical protein